MDRRVVALLLCLAGAAAVPAAAITPELQAQIRASTFEVVMKKPAEDRVEYEKPLPLELLPFVERTDPYRSIGTAFALVKNSYVTAAHVLIAAVDSQYGPPLLRAYDGTLHPIASVQKFSASEDFVVFSVGDSLQSRQLPVNRSPHVDDPVLAVGNALGDGIVIREGLFTSETAEQQDGRWKWIRFSAAASPGNSGGPLLDGAGNIIGVVIAKSPNENLNFALPIANVLDAPLTRARFDQRVLTKLPYAQGSRTYALKDEFALPLSWDTFVLAYQRLIGKHCDAASSALLSAYASSLFPHGSGVESILYGPASPSRELAIVVQQRDDSWALQTPAFKFTELAGDGEVGIASAADAVFLSLHRGNAASDDAFYVDSKSFMDLALRALDFRRPVGADRVKIISLGAARTSELTTDDYGRIWQLRVWPVPFLDSFLVAQLLPTPDGYAGLILFAPSAGLRAAKLQLSMLANQINLNYVGTIAQWHAFLARTGSLPHPLKNVRLSSKPQWALHTDRFDSAIPSDLMTIDSQSKLLMSMSYAFAGPQVVWGIAGVRWLRDIREKAYVDLQRTPRPPASAPQEMRNRFEDLQARRSPYDGAPVLFSSDAMDVSMAIQAPGSKAGMRSSDLAYALSLRIDGHPSGERIALFQKDALQNTSILESGGSDVAPSAPTTVSNQWELLLKQLNESNQQCDQRGKDVRGRLCSEDIEQYILPLYRASFQSPSGSPASGALRGTFSERTHMVIDYWTVAPSVVYNRDLWRPFLIHNHLPEDTLHDAVVLAAESNLNAAISKGGIPTADWARSSARLERAYVEERSRLAREIASDLAAVDGYTARSLPCPAPNLRTSGTDKPRPGPVSHSLQEFYPENLKLKGVEGLVVLSTKVNSSGCVLGAAIAGSSGSDEFDEAALKWVDTASFLPAEKDGKAIDAIGRLAVAFKLN